MESDEELIKLLHDAEEVATARVDSNDDDNFLEVDDDNILSWTLDQIASVVTEEELCLIRVMYGVAEEITLR